VSGSFLSLRRVCGIGREVAVVLCAAALVGRECVVAVEATTGWRWVVRELTVSVLTCGSRIPARRAPCGRRRRAKTDRIDARWLALLLAREMLPEA
jgi:transposase